MAFILTTTDNLDEIRRAKNIAAVKIYGPHHRRYADGR